MSAGNQRHKEADGLKREDGKVITQVTEGNKYKCKREREIKKFYVMEISERTDREIHSMVKLLSDEYE